MTGKSRRTDRKSFTEPSAALFPPIQQVESMERQRWLSCRVRSHHQAHTEAVSGEVIGSAPEAENYESRRYRR